MLLSEISTTEDELVESASEDYGEYYEHAQFAIDFLHTFIKSTSYEGSFFLMFLASAEKHVILGALSGVRLHHVQANFNFRYAVEASSWAAYALAHPDPKYFALFGEDGGLEPTEKLKMGMYKWLNEKYPDGSASLKRFKDSTNKLSTHANIVDAHRNFGDFNREKISSSFFDKEEDHHIKTDLWAVANLAMGMLDIFYGVNRDYPQLILADDFMSKMKKLKEDNNRLKVEMMEFLHKRNPSTLNHAQ